MLHLNHVVHRESLLRHTLFSNLCAIYSVLKTRPVTFSNNANKSGQMSAVSGVGLISLVV